MQRTQIYLPKQQIQVLQKEAKNRETTVSAIIRLFLNEKLQNTITTPKKKLGLVAIAKQIALLSKTKAPKDLAQNLDKYLYGAR